MVHSRASFSLFSSVLFLIVQLVDTGFEPWISSVGSNRSTNCHSTTAPVYVACFLFVPLSSDQMSQRRKIWVERNNESSHYCEGMWITLHLLWTFWYILIRFSPNSSGFSGFRVRGEHGLETAGKRFWLFVSSFLLFRHFIFRLINQEWDLAADKDGNEMKRPRKRCQRLSVSQS